MIEICIDSLYERYSQFNTIVMCGGFDSESRQLYVESSQKVDGESVTRLEVELSHHIETIIYFIPKVIPSGKNIEVVDHPPFEAHVVIRAAEREIYNHCHKINAWGGAAIKLNFEL